MLDYARVEQGEGILPENRRFSGVDGIFSTPSKMEVRFFEQRWTGNVARYVTNGKRNVRKLWEQEYRMQELPNRAIEVPEIRVQGSFIEGILDSLAPTPSTRATRPGNSARND